MRLAPNLGCGRFAARLAGNRSGSVALILAFVLPCIAFLACMGIDLASVSGEHSAFQDAADATALQAVLQLGISDPTGIASRDDQFAKAQIGNQAQNTQYTVNTAISQDSTQVTVTISGVRGSFFGNLLPPGGWQISASSTAEALGKTPLCILSTAQDKTGGISMAGQAQVTAPNCMVHSDEDITVGGSAAMQAVMVQTTGVASGNISPAPQVGAPAIPDPFAGLSLKPPYGCLLPNISIGSTTYLPPGVHCGILNIGKNTTIVLQPGDHYFVQGALQLSSNAAIQGDDVVLIFDDKSQFSFAESSQVNLTGRKSGPFAGFVVATTRSNTGNFTISTDSAHTLVGTVYIPNADLYISGTGNRVADQSAWTAIVAKSIQMQGSPNLVVNANYGSASVPVPSGVGPRSGAHLIN